MLRVAQLQVQEDLQGELQVSQGKPALHCALAMDSAMKTELTVRPNTNSGLHYMPRHMSSGQPSCIQILQLHVFLT